MDFPTFKRYKVNHSCCDLHFITMSQRMKKQSAFLAFLYEASRKQQKLLLSSITTDQLNVIGEIALNIYTGVFPISSRYSIVIKPFRIHIRLLATREITTRKKRSTLMRNIKLISFLPKPVIDQLSKK